MTPRSPLRPTKPALFLGIVVLWGLLGMGTLAAAPAMKPEAKEELEKGLRFYETQQYDKAVSAFQQAYLLDPKPEILYSLAQSFRMQGDCDRAREAYQAFLRTNPEERRAEAARTNASRCQDKVQTAPSSSARSIPAPSASASPKSIAEPRATPRSAWYTDSVGDLFAASGVISLTACAISYGIDKHNQAQMKSATDYSSYESSYHAANTARKVSLVTGIGGIVLVTAGVVRYLTRNPEVNTTTSFGVEFDNRGGGISWTGHF